ncbi:MAG: hypothetical protein E4H31_00575 [Dehalococcoidia bacterium]|nr:MAG: hypothetical protein E4H31_00575 [Dehalococcoidia bacterium]
MNECPIGSKLTHFHSPTLRAIDANLDRAAEGLRVLEDVVRFCLNSTTISKHLKDLRHQLLETNRFSSIELLSARDSAGDVGRESKATKTQASDLSETVVANARRIEQSMRVLEELARLPDSCLDGVVFEKIRYAVYSVEKELVGKLVRQDKVCRLTCGRYIITDSIDDFPDALSSGDVIQLSPGASKRSDFWRRATEAGEQRKNTGTLFIIGEYIDIAVVIKADGVAIGGESLPPSVVRGLLDIDQLIGYAAESVTEALEAEASGVDYLLCPDTLKNVLANKINIPIVTPHLSESR